MKKLIFIFFAIFFLSFVICHSQTWQWAKHFGSSNGDEAGPLCMDSSGNSYITGNFFHPYGLFGTDTVQLVGPVMDIFISKIDNNGNFIWSKRAGGQESFSMGWELGADIKYEKSDNRIIICGLTNANSPNIGTCVLGNGTQTLLSKIDTSGNCIWAQSVASDRKSVVSG